MKKSLLALAMLGAFAGAASAESSLTIYGIVDLGVSKSNDGQSNNPGARGAGTSSSQNATDAAGKPTGPYTGKWALQPGAASRLGFKGVEDLGGGLSAFFNIEHRFTADNGNVANTGAFWHAKSIVGLKGGFGTVTLGRDYIVAFWPAVAGDPWGWDTVGQMGRRYTFANYQTRDQLTNPVTGAADPDSKNNNTVAYQTPSLGGFTATGAVSLGEGTARGGDAGRSVGFNAEYKGGPIYVGLGYDKFQNLSLAGGTNDPSLLVASFGYDIGVVRPTFLYAQSKDVKNAKTQSYILGLTAPIGNGLLKAGFGFLNPDGDANNGKKVSVGYFYSLSKRTQVYTDVGSAKDDGLDRTTSFDFGIKHSF